MGLLTVSDRASDGTYEDKSGPAMEAILTGTSHICVFIYVMCASGDGGRRRLSPHSTWTYQIKIGEPFKAKGLHVAVAARAVVPDDPQRIAAAVKEWCDVQKVMEIRICLLFVVCVVFG